MCAGRWAEPRRRGKLSSEPEADDFQAREGPGAKRLPWAGPPRAANPTLSLLSQLNLTFW